MDFFLKISCPGKMHSPRTSVADRPWKGFELGLRVAVAPSNLIFEVQRVFIAVTW